MQTLPFTSDPAQSFTVPLGDAKYLIAAQYNDIWGVWTFSLTRAADQVQLLADVPILIGQDMLSSYALGIGGLIATDLSGAFLDAGPDDFGDRVIVTWLSPDELAQLEAAGVAL